MWGKAITNRILLSAGVSIAIIAFLLLMLGRSGKSINLARVIETIANIPVWTIFLYACLQIIGAGFRTLRFRVLLRAAIGDAMPSFFHLYLVTMVRNMTVDLLPARLGELAYVAMLNRGYRVDMGACLSSLSLSLWLDLVVLAPLVASIMVFPWLVSDQRIYMSLLVVVVLVFTVFGYFALRYGPAWLLILINKYSQTPNIGLFAKAKALLESVVSGFEGSFKPQVLLKSFALTIGVRACKYLGLLLLFHGVVIQLPAVSEIHPFQALTALIASEAGASLPIPAFMGFGVYEAAGSLSLTAFGFPAVDALLATLSLHISTQFVDYLLGGACLITFFCLTAKPNSSKQGTRRLLPTVLATFSIIIAVYFAYSAYKSYNRARLMVPPPSGAPVIDQERLDAAKRTVQSLDGYVVWSSNRFGNHDIMLMSLPSMNISRLTRHPHTEYFPRISPDGKKIVFSRAHKPWVSQRDPVPWDVILLDISTGVERQLARFANTPTWSADGEYVFFQRNIHSVVRIHVNTGVEEVVYLSGQSPIPKHVELQTPSFLSTKGLAVTFRQGQRMTAVVSETNELLEIAGGCQLSWAPDGSFLYWVDSGGRLGGSIYRLSAGTKQRWLDLPLPFSHEYFPKLEPKGHYLVLAASTGGHEHDVADYELFLWAADNPGETAVRLTYHTGNDNWPDIYLNH